MTERRPAPAGTPRPRGDRVIRRPVPLLGGRCARLVVVAGLVVGLLVGAATVPVPTGAATAERANVELATRHRQATSVERGPLALVQQDPWIGPRGELRLVLDTVSDVETRLDVRVFDAVGDPQDVLRPEEFPDTRQLRRLEPLVVAAGRQRTTVRLPVVPEADGTFGDPLVLDAGVYPVLVTLTRTDGSVLGRLTTHLVRLPATPRRRPLALVVPVHADPDRTSEGRTLIDPEVRGALDRRLELLAAHPAVPVTLQVTPETVNALASDRSGAGTATLERLTSLVEAGAEVVASPFVRLDVDSWHRPDGLGLLGSELDLGRATLDAAGLGTVGDTAAVGDRLDDDLVTWLAGRGLRRLVVPAEAVEEVTWPSAPGSSGDPAVAVVATNAVGPAPGEDGVLAAYRAVAAASVAAIGEESATGQGWALALPDELTTDDTFLRTLLTALDSVGPFTPATVSRFDLPDRSGPEAAPTRVRWAATTPDDLGELPAVLRQAATRLASVATMVGEQPLLVRTRGLIYVAASRDLDDEERDTLVDGVEAIIPLLVGKVTLPRDDGIVVTSHRATLPIVVRYDGPTPIRVAITVRTTELEVEGENPRIIELAPGANDLEIPIRSRRSGEFELEIAATAPDGVVVLETARLTVRSRAISGVGLFLSVGALAYLLLWWFRNRRRQRGASPASGVVADDTDEDTDDDTADARSQPGGPAGSTAQRSPSLAGAGGIDPPRRGPDRPVR